MNEDEQTACYIGKNKYESNIDSKSNYTFFNNLNKPTKSTRTTKSSKVFGTCCEFVQCSTNIPGDKLLHFLSNKCDLSIEPLGEVKKFDRVTRWIFCRTSTHTLKRNTLFLATAWSNPLPTHFSNRKSFAHDVSINFYDPIPFHPRRAKAVLLETLRELPLISTSSSSSRDHLIPHSDAQLSLTSTMSRCKDAIQCSMLIATTSFLSIERANNTLANRSHTVEHPTPILQIYFPPPSSTKIGSILDAKRDIPGEF